VDTSAVAMLPDGTSVLDGESRTYHGGELHGFATVVRLEPDGALDPAFGDGGVVLQEQSSIRWAGPMVTQTDGSIVLAESVYNPKRFGVAGGDLVRFAADGTFEG